MTRAPPEVAGGKIASASRRWTATLSRTTTRLRPACWFTLGPPPREPATGYRGLPRRRPGCGTAGETGGLSSWADGVDACRPCCRYRLLRGLPMACARYAGRRCFTGRVGERRLHNDVPGNDHRRDMHRGATLWPGVTVGVGSNRVGGERRCGWESCGGLRRAQAASSVSEQTAWSEQGRAPEASAGVVADRRRRVGCRPRRRVAGRQAPASAARAAVDDGGTSTSCT